MYVPTLVVSVTPFFLSWCELSLPLSSLPSQMSRHLLHTAAYHTVHHNRQVVSISSDSIRTLGPLDGPMTLLSSEVDGCGPMDGWLVLEPAEGAEAELEPKSKLSLDLLHADTSSRTALRSLEFTLEES